jgi:hypothetical protein
MPTAIQPKVESPDISWIYTNMTALSDNCWVTKEPMKGGNLIVLAPGFGNNLINLGKITSADRIGSSRTFWVRTENTPVVKDRYELGIKVHLVAGAIL